MSKITPCLHGQSYLTTNTQTHNDYSNYTLCLDRHGFLLENNGCLIIPSPNFSERPKDSTPFLLVIHNISLPPYQFGGPYIQQLFTNNLDPAAHPFFKSIAHLKVSAHFLIRRDGLIIQFVSTNKVAFHAGVSSFNGLSSCNSFSLGIELEGSDYVPFTDSQYQRLAQLSRTLQQRYPLTAVRGHEHIAPVRKTDPGPFFDWHRYCNETPWALRQAPPI